MTKYSYLKSKYPDRIPVLVNGINIDKKKYLVPRNFNIGQFVYIIRRRINIKPEQAIFCMIKYENCSVVPKPSDLISQYERGDYLHIYFVYENCYG